MLFSFILHSFMLFPFILHILPMLFSFIPSLNFPSRFSTPISFSSYLFSFLLPSFSLISKQNHSSSPRHIFPSFIPPYQLFLFLCHSSSMLPTSSSLHQEDNFAHHSTTLSSHAIFLLHFSFHLNVKRLFFLTFLSHFFFSSIFLS